MPVALLPAPGSPVDADSLRTRRGISLSKILTPARIPFVSLRELRRRSEPDADVFVLDLEVELPQRPLHDIHRQETVAVTFADDDATYPEVVSLRPDFPLVPHLNLRSEEFPRSLCLYEEPWPDIKLRWSPRAFVERIREWLALTAEGRLHAPDQPVEPFFLTTAGTLVVDEHTRQLATNGGSGTIAVGRVSDEAAGTRPVFVANTSGERADFVAIGLTVSPQAAGVIRRSPGNLSELRSAFLPTGDDLAEMLRSLLRDWVNDNDLLGKRIILLLWVPMASATDERARSDLWAFVLGSTVGELGEALDIWEIREGVAGLILGAAPEKTGIEVAIGMLDVVQALTPATAAQFNGLSGASEHSILAVGMGALGSQVFLNLARAGWGQWVLVDPDQVMPHNLARHALPGGIVGLNKARIMSDYANSLFGGDEPIADSIPVDVLRPSEELTAAATRAALILDMAASVPVARALTTDVTSPARRFSLFLNPTGTDLVLLAEDSPRSVALESLEMQYLRGLLESPELDGHLVHDGTAIRYGRGCREASWIIPQDLVALHASLGARAVRTAFEHQAAQVTVWRAREDGTVEKVDLPVHPAMTWRTADWEIWTDESVVTEARELRHTRLPGETGGVLLGAVDAERRRIYVAKILPSPADSVEWPTIYIRGSQGLRAVVEDAERRTNYQMGYVGEWHSHPSGATERLSGADARGLEELARLRAIDGAPSVALILSAEREGWYVHAEQAAAVIRA